MLEKFRHYVELTNFAIIKLPTEVKKFARKIILFGILSALIPDVLSFSLKISQMCLKANLIAPAIIFILLHFGDWIFLSLFQTWEILQNDNYSQLITNESTKIIMDVSNTTKSKVFKSNGKIIQMVEQPEIIKIVKDYVDDFWGLYVKLPTTLFQVTLLVGMLIASIKIELSSSSVLETIVITSLLVACIITYFFLSRKRVKVRRSYRKTVKENEAVTDILYTEIKSTDFISQNDFSYHAERLRSKLDENIQINRAEHLKLNKIFVERSLVASLLMIMIMLLKFFTSGQFTIETFVDVVALSSIYSSILQRITNITINYENIMNVIVDLDTLYDGFCNINNVYEEEQRKNWMFTPIESLSVSKFNVTQDLNGSFELINDVPFSFGSGDTIITYGKTGCGKSTLINMITGKISLPLSPINFSNGKTGYLNSIGYQTDKAMANNYVLNEITLTDDFESVDIPRLFEIIKGLHLYDEILRMVKEENLVLNNLTDDGKVIEFLKIRKVREFSSGQMQRLALSKLLYSLDDTIQLVALDEPFNRLDDATCKECLKFVHEFVHRKPRILLIATHQIEICRPYATIEISFDEDMSKSILRIHSK